MPISDAVHTNLATALKGLSLPDVTRSQAEMLIEHHSVSRVQQLFAAARAQDTEAKVELHKSVLACKAVEFLHSLGKTHATLPLLIDIITQRTYPTFREVMVAAGEGDANASTILDQWLSRSARGDDSPDLDEPLHATDVPPPGDQAPMQAQRSAQPAQRSGSRPTAQAYRAEPSAAPRTPATAQQDNVRDFPRGGRPQSPADEEFDVSSSDNAPADAQRRSAGQGGQRSERQYDQHACYGKDVAIQFDRSPTPDRTTNTVNFKIAKAKYAGKTCKEGVDWQNGITMMLEPHEVQLVYAVLMGMGPKFRAAGHGRDNQKWFEIEETTDQFAGAIRITVGNGRNDIRKVNIGFQDAKEVMEIFSRTLQDQGRGQSPVFMLAEVRRVYDLYAKKQAVSASRQRASG
jgi:hypothetical protein